jgi:hypothetical protein
LERARENNKTERIKEKTKTVRKTKIIGQNSSEKNRRGNRNNGG